MTNQDLFVGIEMLFSFLAANSCCVKVYLPSSLILLSDHASKCSNTVAICMVLVYVAKNSACMLYLVLKLIATTQSTV